MTNPSAELYTINRQATEDASGLIEQVERDYDKQIERTARSILAGGQRIVMLAGPSGSGKTTTADFFVRHFKALGASAVVVSLDDFYRSPEDMPLLDDGSPDFESVHSLDLAHLHRCLCDLIERRRCELPIFDFVNHGIDKKTRLLELEEGDVVLFEGLHALNPLICDRFPAAELYRLHVHVGQDILLEGELLLSARDLRLVRRMLRDARFRSSPPSNTLTMWKGVVRGEEQYLNPYKHTARSTVDSLHRYEPCIFRGLFLELVEQVKTEDPNYSLIQRVRKALSLFEPLPVEMVPKTSLLREFIGF